MRKYLIERGWFVDNCCRDLDERDGLRRFACLSILASVIIDIIAYRILGNDHKAVNDWNNDIAVAGIWKNNYNCGIVIARGRMVRKLKSMRKIYGW